MHDAVPDVWIRFNRDLEGIVTTMYADALGLVSIGMGNLIDPIDLAIMLPFRLPGGIGASTSDIKRAWTAVKNDPKCAKLGWKYAAMIPANNLRLEMHDVEALIERKLREHDRFMLSRFPDWEARPADAQLAVHSMAWAMGPAFFRKFPRFTLAFGRGDYADACKRVGVWGDGLAKYECDIAPVVVDGKPVWGTIKERNRRNRLLLESAARGGPPDQVSWQQTSP